MAIETVSILDASSVAQPISADKVGTDYVQVVKVAYGADGSVTMVDGTNALPVAGVRANDGSAVSAGATHLTMGGSDGTNLRPVSIDTAGRPNVNINGTVPVSGSVTVGGSVSVSGNVEVTNDVGNPLPVNGTITANAGTNLNTSALALEAGNLATASATLTTISGKLPAVLGQAAAASSMAVTLSNENINDLSITGQATQTAAGNNIVLAVAGTGSTDCQQYRMVGIEIIPTGTVSSGVVTFEGSNDNTNFQAIPLYDVNSLLANPVTTVSPATGVNRFFAGPLVFRYFRARISTVIGGGGSLQAFTIFRMADFAHPQQTITQATAANLNATVTATNLSCNVAQMAGVAVLMNAGVTGTGSPRVTIAQDCGPGTHHHLIAAATTNATSVKASAGTVGFIVLCNDSATKRYFKFFNKASAPTTGTDTPTEIIVLQPNTTYSIPVGGADGLRFSLGIAYAITANAADLDNTAVAAGDVIVNLAYN